MSRREAWLTVALVFGVAVLVRVAAATLIPFPRPEDTAYYVGVARNIAEGRGLVSDALWSYGTPPLRFPRDAFEVWLPLPSLVAAIPVRLLGGPGPIPLETAFRAAQVTSVLWGALVAVLAWRLASDVAAERRLPAGRARTLAIGAGLATGVYLPLLLLSALPDSTMPFAALALGACLLMARVVREPPDAPLRDARLWGIGALLGLAALTRNEAVWLALAWVWLAWRLSGRSRGFRAALVGIVAAVSLAIFAPWAARDWAVFGNPLPGQALSNALSVTGFDIFAWNHPPNLSTYLAQGPAALLDARLVGLGHNLANVLLYLGLPVSLIGLLALPWQGRDHALRPLLILSLTTFLVTSLAFPVATTWGTFLHAAGPVHVLLIVSALGALDSGFAWLSRRMAWERPVAWLGALLTVFASALFSAALVPSFGGSSQATEDQYAVLARQMAAIGAPFEAGSPPVIHDFPIWLAETERVSTLALPNESPADVLTLADRFGARWVIVAKPDHGDWPSILAGPDPKATCYQEVDLNPADDPAIADALGSMRAFRLGCPPAASRGAGPAPAGRPSP